MNYEVSEPLPEGCLRNPEPKVFRLEHGNEVTEP